MKHLFHDTTMQTLIQPIIQFVILNNQLQIELWKSIRPNQEVDLKNIVLFFCLQYLNLSRATVYNVCIFLF